MLAAVIARGILATSLFVTSAVAVPQAAIPVVPQVWSNVLDQPNFKIDIDPRSIKLIVRNGGFEMLSTLRMNFGKPIELPARTIPGAYYVNNVVAKCRDDTLVIEKSTVYSADHQPLSTGESVAVMKNPKNAQSFITVWLHLSCNQFKGKRPPTFI